MTEYDPANQTTRTAYGDTPQPDRAEGSLVSLVQEKPKEKPKLHPGSRLPPDHPISREIERIVKSLGI